MAARFTVALAREEYDFSDDRVMDRIYWYVMFILSASSMFDYRLLHNVGRVAENCFRLFKPSLLEPLKKLRDRTKKDDNESYIPTNGTGTETYEEMYPVLQQLIDGHAQRERAKSYTTECMEALHPFIFFQNDDQHSNDDFFPSRERTKEENLLEPLLATVSEIVYPRLQPAIAQRTIKKLLSSKSIFAKKASDPASKHRILLFDFQPMLQLPCPPRKSVCLTSNGEETIKRMVLNGILENELVQSEIGHLTATAIPTLIRALEYRHIELMKKIQNYGDRSQSLDDLFQSLFMARRRKSLEELQLDVLVLDRVLEKLRQSTITVEEIRQLVVERLCEIAVRQITSLAINQHIIRELRQFLSEPSKTESSTSSETPRHYQVHQNKSLPKKQLKHSRP